MVAVTFGLVVTDVKILPVEEEFGDVIVDVIVPTVAEKVSVDWSVFMG